METIYQNIDYFKKVLANGNIDLIIHFYNKHPGIFEKIPNINLYSLFCDLISAKNINYNLIMWIYSNTIEKIDDKDINNEDTESCNAKRFRNRIDISKNDYLILFNCIQWSHYFLFKVFLKQTEVTPSAQIVLVQEACNQNNPFILECCLEKFGPVDIYKENHFLFNIICQNQVVDIAILLDKYYPQYIVEIDYDVDNDPYIENYYVKRYWQKPTENIVKREDCDINEECPICYCNIPNIMTDCKHFFCNDCISVHYERNGDSCPLCRSNVNDYYSISE
jgi:hypothetical protein